MIMRQNMRMLSPVNTCIVLANILVFIYLEIAGSTMDTMFMLDHGADYWPYVFEGKEYYRLFTSGFLHFGIAHLFNNMLILGYLGTKLEKIIGSIKYLILYVVVIFGSSIASTVGYMLQNKNTVSAGASGAVFGVVGFLLYMVIVNRGYIREANLGMRQLVLFVVYSLYTGFTSGGVDNMAHIGGLVLGVLMGVILYRKNDYGAGSGFY